DKKKAETFQDILEIITEVRAVNAAVGANKPALYYKTSADIAENAELIARLGRLGKVAEAASDRGQGMRIAKAGYDVWLDIDTGAVRAYLDKLIDQKTARQQSVERLEGRLASSGYTERAPAQIVDQTRQQLEEEKTMLTQTIGEIDTFTKLAES
ncbi:MAG: valyl-tRNA synthetase, partial [Candidatus Saccharibacteria bacterium]|nr:valyl-tRNA synthetase [Candidatus Saccharibacteria bacterium]